MERRWARDGDVKTGWMPDGAEEAGDGNWKRLGGDLEGKFDDDFGADILFGADVDSALV